MVLRESARTEREARNRLPTNESEKSSEGRSPRALGAEIRPQGSVNESRWEGSQTLRAGPPPSKATLGGRPLRRARKGIHRSGNAVGQWKLDARCPASADHGRHETWVVGRRRRRKTLRRRRSAREDVPVARILRERATSGLKTLRSGESQGRKGWKQAICFLGTRGEKL